MVIKKSIILTMIIMLSIMTSCSVSNNGINMEKTKQGKIQVNGLGKGNIPPDFQIKSTDDKIIRISDFSSKNKPAIIYFMATWCPHCANDFEALNNVYQEYEDKVPIVVMSLDNKESRKIINDYRNNYPNLNKIAFSVADETVLRDYNVRFTTTKYALDQDRTIIYAGSGELTEDQWKTLLDAVI